MPTLHPGDKASRTQTISDEMVRSFADLTGDTNPVLPMALERFGQHNGTEAAGLTHGSLPLTTITITVRSTS